MSTVFGDYVRLVRQFKGITQRTLAERLNMEQSLLSRWERGDLQRPSPEFAQAVARALAVHPAEVGLAVIGIMPRGINGLPLFEVAPFVYLPEHLSVEQWAKIIKFADELT